MKIKKVQWFPWIRILKYMSKSNVKINSNYIIELEIKIVKYSR